MIIRFFANLVKKRMLCILQKTILESYINKNFSLQKNSIKELLQKVNHKLWFCDYNLCLLNHKLWLYNYKLWLAFSSVSFIVSLRFSRWILPDVFLFFLHKTSLYFLVCTFAYIVKGWTVFEYTCFNNENIFLFDITHKRAWTHPSKPFCYIFR